MSRLRNAAGCNNRDFHRVHHRRQQREQPNRHAFGPPGFESPAMAAGFRALRHQHIGAGGFSFQRLGNRGDGGEPGDAVVLHRGHESRRI